MCSSGLGQLCLGGHGPFQPGGFGTVDVCLSDHNLYATYSGSPTCGGLVSHRCIFSSYASLSLSISSGVGCAGVLLCDKTGTGFSSVPPRSMYVSVLSTERLITGPSEKDFLLSTTKSPITSPFSKFITSTNPLPSTK